MAVDKKTKEKTNKHLTKNKIVTIVVWSALVAFVLICFTLNIYYANKPNANANLLTALAGWFAFLATIGVAYFAFYSDRKNKQEAEMQRLIDRIEIEVKKIDNAKIVFAKEMQFVNLENEMIMIHEMWGHKKEICTMLSQNAVHKRVDIMTLLLKDVFSSPIFYECRKEALGAVIDFNQFILEYARLFGEKNLKVLLEAMPRYKEKVEKTFLALIKFSTGASNLLNSWVTLSYKEFIKQMDEAKVKCLEIDKELYKNYRQNNATVAKAMESVLPKID